MKKKRWPQGCELILSEKKEFIEQEAKEKLKKKLIEDQRKAKFSSRRGGVSSAEIASRMGSYTVGSYADVEKKDAMGPMTRDGISFGGVDEIMNLNDSEEEDDGTNNKKGRRRQLTEVDLASPAPQGACFETLNDESTSLLLKEGQRLKFDLSDLVDDEWKKRAVSIVVMIPKRREKKCICVSILFLWLFFSRQLLNALSSLDVCDI